MFPNLTYPFMCAWKGTMVFVMGTYHRNEYTKIRRARFKATFEDLLDDDSQVNVYH
jgi:hypothetical protein